MLQRNHRLLQQLLQNQNLHPVRQRHQQQEQLHLEQQLDQYQNQRVPRRFQNLLIQHLPNRRQYFLRHPKVLQQRQEQVQNHLNNPLNHQQRLHQAVLLLHQHVSLHLQLSQQFRENDLHHKLVLLVIIARFYLITNKSFSLSFKTFNYGECLGHYRS